MIRSASMPSQAKSRKKTNHTLSEETYSTTPGRRLVKWHRHGHTRPRSSQNSALTIEAVSSVRIIGRIGALLPQELHDFVLALTRDPGIAKNDLEAAPAGVRVQAYPDIELQALGEPAEEGCAWCDHVGVLRNVRWT